MSTPRGLGQNGGRLYSNITKPVSLDIKFTVDSANTNGLGIRSLKSNGYVRNVFMHTSSTPGSNNGALNPNPAVGYALVQFENNFNYFLNMDSTMTPPLASSNLTSTTAGNAYVIVTTGTTTLAQFQAAGLPQGLTPTVGQSFIAIRTGSLGGTGTLGAPGIPTIQAVSVVGDPNTSISNSSIASSGGAYVLLQLVAATNSSTTTLVAAAPADSTVISLNFKFDSSSVTIDGL